MRTGRARPLDELRALAPMFLRRFLERDADGDSHDLRPAIFVLIAMVAVPGLAVPMLIGLGALPIDGPEGWGWSMTARFRGVEALRDLVLGDKALYLGAGMAVTGLISALTWHSLLPDRRDVLVLGMTPARPPVIVLARLVGLAAFVASIAAAMHGPAAVSFGTFLAAENTTGFLLRGIVAHFVAAFGASVFMLGLVTTIQGVAVTALGPRVFARVSPALQLCLVAVVVAGFAWLPTVSDTVHARVDALGDTGWSGHVFNPVLWFLGLYEVLLGTDSVALARLARVAMMGLAVTMALTAATYPVVYARLTRSALDAPPRRRPRYLVRLVPHLLSRDSEEQTIAGFTLAALGRLERQRFVVAAALGAGVAWGLPGWLALSRAVPAALTPAIAATAFSTMGLLLLGLWLAMVSPADLRAAWIFDLGPIAWVTHRRAAERLLVGLGVVPVVAAFAIWFGVLWGWPTALAYGGFACASGVLIVQILLRHHRALPCTTPWRFDGGRLKATWPVYLLSFVILTVTLPWLASRLAQAPAVAMVAVAFVLAVALALRRYLIWRGSQPDPDALDLPGEALFAVFRRSGRLAAVTRTPDWREVLAPRRLTEGVRLFWQDTTLALRRLRHRAAFSMFAVATIALGVGATVVVHALVRDVILKPAPVRDIDRVVNLYNAPQGSTGTRLLSWLDYQNLRAAQTVFSEMAAWRGIGVLLASPSGTTAVTGEAVEGTYFTLVGATTALGRPIQPADDLAGAAPVVVLSHAAWRARFAADPGIVGRIVRLNDRPFEVIGVAVPGFEGVVGPVLVRTDLWVPLASLGLIEQRSLGDDRRDGDVFAKARLAAGRSVADAEREMWRVARSLDTTAPLVPGDPRYSRRGWRAIPASSVYVYEWFSPFAMPLAIGLTTLVVLVLLVACTNLANLTLARAMVRRREMAVRLALGASRLRLVREQVVEALLLAAAAGVAAWWMASHVITQVLDGALVRLTGSAAAAISVSVPASVWFVLGGALLASVVVCGVWPAWRLTSLPARQGLAESTMGAAGSGWRGRQRLVAAQVAVAVLLLSTTVTFVTEIASRSTRDPGFDLDRLAVVHLLRAGAYADDVVYRDLTQRLLEPVRQLPGVRAAALASGLPVGLESGRRQWISVPGRPRVEIRRLSATPDYLDVLDVPVVAGGRTVTAGTGQMLVSARAARQLFSGTDVVGRTVLLHTGTSDVGEPRTIAGVVGDTDVGDIGSRHLGLVVTSLDGESSRPTLVVRTAGDPQAAADRIRAFVEQIGPDIAVTGATSGRTAVGLSNTLPRATAMLSGVLGLAALVMAVTGLFGVLSQQVIDRTAEIGIRAALGATRRQISRLVVLDALRPVGMGLLGGFAAAVFLRQVGLSVYGPAVPEASWIALIVVPAVLAGATLAAAWLPGRRAASVEPTTALRAG